MKKGKFVLTVSIGTDLDEVESVAFKFRQNGRELLFKYPSANAVRSDDKINLIWTAKQAFMFNEGKLYMDTLIKIKNAATNPETEIVELDYKDTLFTRSEVEELG